MVGALLAQGHFNFRINMATKPLSVNTNFQPILEANSDRGGGQMERISGSAGEKRESCGQDGMDGTTLQNGHLPRVIQSHG